MLKRVFTVFSVSLALIIFIFVIAILNLAQVKGIIPPINKMMTSSFMLSIIFFEVFLFIGGVYTGIANKKQNKKLLLIGTVFFAFSSIPSVIRGMGADNPLNVFMLTIFSLAPVLFNVIHLIMFDMPIANKDIAKSILGTNKKSFLNK